ncbi:hypothetical protein CDAR_529361 [Caerostris darwini]|uniref:Uncharacterized protein n=1 Tax=Caerostris darwini TaxID=1538125 RepID=A0AAV4NNA2_9ARAC|nr:hypothetical protein CDAR_529361 [Caerostris darwini]
MPHLLQIDINALRVRCDNISSEMQDWQNICSNITERAKLLVTAEINNLTYPLCHRKQEEILNLLGTVKRHIEASEAKFTRFINLKRMLVQHDYIMLLKNILEEELR